MTTLIKHIPNIVHPPVVKPFIKWVGGKTQIMRAVIQEFPTEMNNYREIFLGGGSVLLAFLSYVKAGIIKVNGNIYAHDLNEPLIYIYKNIQTNHIELFNVLQAIVTKFNTIPDGIINRTPTTIEEAVMSKENYYYWTRKQYNALSCVEKCSILGSALFMFLNKTCFRGIFRVGPNGFNVPYGHNKNPEIINMEHVIQVHQLIQGVHFICSDFTQSMSVEAGDYLYLDPPYAPEKDRSFVGYTENGFSLENHKQLFKMLREIDQEKRKKEKIRFLLSNADVQLVRENFPGKKYDISSIECKRSINSKNPAAKAQEVLIKNY